MTTIFKPASRPAIKVWRQVTMVVNGHPQTWTIVPKNQGCTVAGKLPSNTPLAQIIHGARANMTIETTVGPHKLVIEIKAVE